MPPYSWSRQADPTFRTGSVSKDPRYLMTRVLLRPVGLVFFVSTVVSAQPPPALPPMLIEMPVGAQGVPLPQLPPRDNSQPAKQGTATLRGHCLAADTGQPLRKAQVRICAAERPDHRMASTDGC